MHLLLAADFRSGDIGPVGWLNPSLGRDGIHLGWLSPSCFLFAVQDDTSLAIRRLHQLFHDVISACIGVGLGRVSPSMPFAVFAPWAVHSVAEIYEIRLSQGRAFQGLRSSLLQIS